MSQEAQKTIHTITNLPLLDANVLEILALLNKPDTNFNDIIKSLSPEVTTRFLKMANSSFYGQQVQDINHALRVLGFNAMKHSLLTALMMGHLEQKINPASFDIILFHKQAQLCALVSNFLAHILDYEKKAEIFTASIMHNIGELVIAAYFPAAKEMIGQMRLGQMYTTSEAEKATLGLNHAEISATLLKQYNIPDNLCRAIRYHEDFNRPFVEDEDCELEFILRAAAKIIDTIDRPGDLSLEEITTTLRTISQEGHARIQQLRNEALKDKGYPEIFQDLLREASTFTRDHLEMVAND